MNLATQSHPQHYLDPTLSAVNRRRLPVKDSLLLFIYIALIPTHRDPPAWQWLEEKECYSPNVYADADLLQILSALQA